MSSPAQILANRQNALSSTGPNTPEGKAASSKNATRHGLSSAFTVLAHEDQDDFNELIEDVIDEHKPVTQHQVFLVEQLAKTWWLVCRAQRLEAKAFDRLAGVEFDPEDADARIVAEMSKTNPNVLNTLQRYAAQAERSYYKAYKELKAAKQIQNEADYIQGLSKVRVTDRVLNQPNPAHPASRGPVSSQYGYAPAASGPRTSPPAKG